MNSLTLALLAQERNRKREKSASVREPRDFHLSGSVSEAAPNARSLERSAVDKCLLVSRLRRQSDTLPRCTNKKENDGEIEVE